MDILSENLPQLVPGPTDLEKIISHIEDSADLRTTYDEGVAKEGEGAEGYHTPCDRDYLVALCTDSCEISWAMHDFGQSGIVNDETFLVYFTKIIDEIERVIQHPELLAINEDCAAFRQAIKFLLASMHAMGSHLWLQQKSTRYNLPEDIGGTFKKIPWVFFLQNWKLFPKEEQMSQAIKSNSRVLASEQLVPRGGMMILERWADEINEAIDDIMEVSLDEDQDSPELESQMVERSDLYASTQIESVGSLLRTQLNRSQTIDDVLPEHSVVEPIPLSELGELMAALDGAVNYADGLYLCLRVSRSADIERLEEWFETPSWSADAL